MGPSRMRRAVDSGGDSSGDNGGDSGGDNGSDSDSLFPHLERLLLPTSDYRKRPSPSSQRSPNPDSFSLSTRDRSKWVGQSGYLSTARADVVTGIPYVTCRSI